MEKPVRSVIASVSGLSLNDFEKKAFAKYNPAGVSLFGRNIRDKKQLADLTKEIREVLERDDVLIAVDQEGGRVRRLTEPEWRIYAPQSVLGKADPLATKYHAALISGDLHEAGINMNYAPVLDVLFKQTGLSLRSRCFSDDEKVVAKLGKIMLDEYIEAGICPCIKHMPGHGRAVNDPHLSLPRPANSLKDLEKDFYPFRALNYSPAGMTAHMVIGEVDDRLPITQSKKGIDTVIRGIIGFDGFLISDALDMKALSGSWGEKTAASLGAGCDAVCYYTDREDDATEIYENAKILSDKSYLRFEKIRNIIKNKRQVKDVAEIAGKYQEMVKSGLESYLEEYDATMVLTQMKKN